MGADLPLGFIGTGNADASVHYFFDFPAMRSQTARLAEVRIPARFVNALDDTWARPASRDAFIKGHGNTPTERADLPAGRGMPNIGHMSDFRAGSEPLWDQALDWFERPGAPGLNMGDTNCPIV